MRKINQLYKVKYLNKVMRERYVSAEDLEAVINFFNVNIAMRDAKLIAVELLTEDLLTVS